MINQNFFDENERVDLKKLEEFNAKVKLFDYLEATPVKHHTDATGYSETKLGERRNFNIELKNRNLNLLDDGRISGCTKEGKPFMDNTIFIESHKAADLLFDYLYGLEGLYINFLLDGHVLIFNLNNLKKRPVKTATMNIRSKGYNKFEVAKRQGLYLVDAAIFDKDGKLIKKAGQDFDGDK
jgi:hypothetical protein